MLGVKSLSPRTHVILWVVSLFVLGCWPSLADVTKLKTIPPALKAIATDLPKVTQVPLLLPARLPKGKDQPPLYATVTVRNTTQYEIILGLAQDCQGGNACRWGTLSGERLTPNTPSIAKQFATYSDPGFEPWAKLPEDVKRQFGPVSLTRGRAGFFVPAICGANCGDSMLFWEQNGFRYMVGVKAGERKALIELANSVIENERS